MDRLLLDALDAVLDALDAEAAKVSARRLSPESLDRAMRALARDKDALNRALRASVELMPDPSD